MNKKKYLFWLAICICFVGLYSLSSYGMVSEDRVIRVGFPIQGGLAQKDEDGNYSGYTYDYLQEIAQYTGWEYEFVEMPTSNESLNNMLDMLSNGELDLVGGLVKNEQTQQLYGFPEYGYGFNYTCLSVPENNTKINENNFQSIKGLKIAVYKNSTFTREKVRAYCELNNIEYQEVEKNTELEMVEAVKNGEADVVVGNSLTPYPGMRIIAQFNGSEYYFATPKKNTEMLSELNRTILTIKQTKPYFDSSLHNKYFVNLSNKVYFSEEESTYINAAKPIRIVLLSALEPIMFVDGEGTVNGIGKNILDLIEEEAGLRFEYVFAKDYDEAYELLASSQADAICGMPYDYDLAQQNGMIMSNSFLTSQMVMVTTESRGDDTTGKSVGVLNENKALKKTDGIELRPFKTVEEMMEAVIKDKVDYAYLNLYSAEYLGHLSKFKDIRMIPQSDKTAEFCIGIKKPVDTMLISIINKVLYGITSSEIEAIIYQNTTNVEADVTLTTFIETNPMLSIVFVLVLSLCAVSIVALVYWIQMKAVKRLDVENRRYLQLCELANEYIYEYDLKQDKFTCSKEFAGLFAFPVKIENFSNVTEDVSKLSGAVDREIFYSLKPILINQFEKEAEYLCLVPGGEQRWFRNTQVKIKTSDGAVYYIIGKLTDIQNEKAEKEVLEQRVMRDGLTGIYNSITSKQLIDEKLGSLDKCGAILIIDLDVFKQVNDTLGHFTGDLVLRDFAQLLEKTSGPEDIAGRIGGDEFVLFVHDAKDFERTSEFCGRLCESARRTYINDEGKTYPITISIGAALVRENCNYLEVYQYADRELYRAKNTGRDCYSISEYIPNKIT